MEITIYGENRLTIPFVFVLYAVEVGAQAKHIEIFRQRFTFMPRYEHGDVIQFKRPGDQDIEDQYVVDRVVNCIICTPQPQQGGNPQYQNQVRVIMRPQSILENSEYRVYNQSRGNVVLHE